MPGEFIDTNIVIYSLDKDGQKQQTALALLADKPVMSVQVLSETANIMRRKLGFDITAIRAVIHRISQECLSLQPINLSTLNNAFDIAERYRFSHYDSLIIAAALQAECTTLYSEDMQHGQIIDNRMMVINPFL
ncbi:MAG: PIN domain-containing protein [Methylovulum miyakonense]|uniref:PIN domain-containing protein n=1 Tax=Methylovulum miyakonense TaxID=645578 RepID=UPI003BB6EC1B